MLLGDGSVQILFVTYIDRIEGLVQPPSSMVRATLAPDLEAWQRCTNPSTLGMYILHINLVTSSMMIVTLQKETQFRISIGSQNGRLECWEQFLCPR
jgi:hypothetical protein